MDRVHDKTIAYGEDIGGQESIWAWVLLWFAEKQSPSDSDS